MSNKIVLASSSIYRRDLLKRILSNFTTMSPEIDETPSQNESPKNLAMRLSVIKAKKVSSEINNKDTFVIGCDQTAVCENTLLKKPMSYEKAYNQLKFLSGKNVKFFSAFCVFNESRNLEHTNLSEFTALYRKFTDNEIEQYLKKDEPYKCVGSIKSESLGITMLEKIKSDDPTAIIGLPLIKLSKVLSNHKLI